MNPNPYWVFLLSDKNPSQTMIEGHNLETMVRERSGAFTATSFSEILNVTSDLRSMESKFDELFQGLWSDVDVLIIDLDFLDNLWQGISQKDNNLRNYLIGIFCLSFMSAKRSWCKNCSQRSKKCIECRLPKESHLRKLDALVISPSGKKAIFPEFIDWIRDKELKSHENPICSEKDLDRTLATIEARHTPPPFIAGAYAVASNVYSDFRRR